MENKYIKLSHGSGKGQDELLREIIIPILLNNTNSLMEDSAILKNKNKKLAFTTDSFVVTPLEFPGADIGKLAACGTINDLSMMGAIPEYISVALILEEGLEVELLKRVLKSLKKITDECSVQIVCGDTKVVSKGSADGIFITTAGIGYIPDKYSVSIKKIRKNDAIIVSGTIGLHGVTVLSKRKNLDFVTDIESDCAPLDDISQRLLTAVPETHALRDATRGGVSAVLNEIASSIDLTFEIDENTVPVDPRIKGVCGYLGLDPLNIANEGRFVAFVPDKKAPEALKVLRKHPLGKDAQIIGRVISKEDFPVIMKTSIGALRPLEMPPGEMLPRIC